MANPPLASHSWMDLPLASGRKKAAARDDELVSREREDGAAPPMMNEGLDQTGSYRRRSEDYPPPDPGAFRASGHGINFPTAIFLYLIAQLVGSIWWAATIQAKSSFLEAENAKLWQKIELHDLQLNRQESVIRAQVREFVGDEMDKNRNRDRD
jgi:hypothetical protein